MFSFLLGLVIALLVLLLWLFVRPRESERVVVDDESIDRQILRAAEEEVSGLGAAVTPEEATEELPDWGPGAPRS